jgi:hypothetical protein
VYYFSKNGALPYFLRNNTPLKRLFSPPIHSSVNDEYSLFAALRQNRTLKKFKDVAHFFALKAQKNEQRPKGILLSTPFERSQKQGVFIFNTRM